MTYKQKETLPLYVHTHTRFIVPRREQHNEHPQNELQRVVYGRVEKCYRLVPAPLELRLGWVFIVEIYKNNVKKCDNYRMNKKVSLSFGII